MRRILLFACLAVVPASGQVASATETQLIRIATLAPRDSDLARGFRRLDQSLRAVTQNAWGVRLYPSGVAGDEIDVIRKLKISQLDAAVITSVGLSQIVREVDVLNAPGVIESYRQLEAVLAAFTPEWEQSFQRAGFVLLSWGESGQYRWFARSALRKPRDVAHMRPWLWPASHALKEMYRVLGVNGVPLAAPEVFGALQTQMIDMVVATALAVVALQWHASLTHVTARPVGGVLVGGWLISAARWNALPEPARAQIRAQITQNAGDDRRDMRQADERSYRALIRRGYTADAWDGAAEKEYAQMASEVRSRLVGRVYPAEVLQRALLIAQAN